MSTTENTIGRRSFLGMGAAAALGLWADLEAYPQNACENFLAMEWHQPQPG